MAIESWFKVVIKIMSIWEWYYHYNNESKCINNTRREYGYAFLGTLKIGFWFGVFADVMMLFSVILSPLFNLIFNDKMKPMEDIVEMFIGTPICALCIFMVITFISMIFRPRILKMYNNEPKNEFLTMIANGYDGWFQACVFAGVGKKDRNKFEKRQ